MSCREICLIPMMYKHRAFTWGERYGAPRCNETRSHRLRDGCFRVRFTAAESAPAERPIRDRDRRFRAQAQNRSPSSGIRGHDGPEYAASDATGIGTGASAVAWVGYRKLIGVCCSSAQVERASDIRYRRAMNLPSEQEEAAAMLLREIHAQAQATLRKIDADLAESRRQARLYAKLKIQTHNETMVWLKAHPDEVQTISELFGF